MTARKCCGEAMVWHGEYWECMICGTCRTATAEEIWKAKQASEIVSNPGGLGYSAARNGGKASPTLSGTTTARRVNTLFGQSQQAGRSDTGTAQAGNVRPDTLRGCERRQAKEDSEHERRTQDSDES